MWTALYGKLCFTLSPLCQCLYTRVTLFAKLVVSFALHNFVLPIFINKLASLCLSQF